MGCAASSPAESPASSSGQPHACQYRKEEEKQQQALLAQPPVVLRNGRVRPISFGCVYECSKAQHDTRPGKKTDPRPSIYVRLQRATNLSKGEAKRWLLLDTGALRTSISEADAKCLNLFAKSQVTGEVPVKNAAGVTSRPTARIVVTALEGQKEISSVQLTANVRSGDLGHGLLGMDWIAAVGWASIDFAGGKEREAAKRRQAYHHHRRPGGGHHTRTKSK